MHAVEVFARLRRAACPRSDYSWKRASDRRDWMISSEESEYPDDSSHVKGLESAGAELVRGRARIVGRAASRSVGPGVSVMHQRVAARSSPVQLCSRRAPAAGEGDLRKAVAPLQVLSSRMKVLEDEVYA